MPSRLAIEFHCRDIIDNGGEPCWQFGIEQFFGDEIQQHDNRRCEREDPADHEQWQANFGPTPPACSLLMERPGWPGFLKMSAIWSAALIGVSQADNPQSQKRMPLPSELGSLMSAQWTS